MLKFLPAAGAALALALAAAPAGAATFTGDYSVSFRNSDPGLVLQVQDLPGALNFSLNNVGDTASAALFKVWTNEAAVNADDLVSYPIAVTFGFTGPNAFGGVVNGQSQGSSALFGLFQNGSINWAGGGSTVLNFGNGGKLLVDLDDVVFNSGVLGLKGGVGHAATICAEFTLLQASVPEPGAWALMIVGFGLVGTAVRRRRGLAQPTAA